MGLDRTSTFRGERESDFYQGGCNFHINYKSEISNDKKSL